MTDATAANEIRTLLQEARRAQEEAGRRLQALQDHHEAATQANDSAVLAPLADVVLRMAHQASTRAVLEHLIHGMRQMLPWSGGVILLRLTDGETATLNAFWHPEGEWVEGSSRPDSMPEELERLSRGDTTPDIHLPLRGHGLSVGECRLWLPEGITCPGNDAVPRIISETAGLAIAGLYLQTASRQRSVREPLTGLFNRRYLEDTLRREVHRSRRTKQPLGIIQLDLDGLAEFNNLNGRTAGDRLLQAVAGMLQSTFRGSDAACRTDDDTFVVVMPDADLQATQGRAEELRDHIGAMQLALGDRTLRGIPASVGVASYPDLAITPDELLLAADSAVELARQAGGNRVEIAQRAG